MCDVHMTVIWQVVVSMSLDTAYLGKVQAFKELRKLSWSCKSVIGVSFLCIVTICFQLCMTFSKADFIPRSA